MSGKSSSALLLSIALLVGLVAWPGPGKRLYATFAVTNQTYLPIQMRQVPAAQIGVGSLGGSLHGAAVVNHLAYAGIGTRLVILDLSNPTAPQRLGAVELPSLINAVAIDGNTAYAVTGPTGLRVIDVTNPTQPREIGFYDSLGRAIDVAVANGYAYVAEETRVRVVDVTEPTAPTLETSLTISDSFPNVKVQNGRLYLTDIRLRLYDLADPANPVQVSTFDAGSWTNNLAVNGDIVYLLHYDGLRAVDVSQPSNPALLTYLPSSASLEALILTPGYAYADTLGEGIAIYDLGDPAAPVAIGSYVAGDLNPLGAADGTLLAEDDVGLVTLDIAAPALPATAGRYLTGQSWPERVVSAGNRAFLAMGSFGLWIADVSQPAEPFWLGVYDPLGEVNDVAVSGSLAYTAAGEEGLVVVDVSQPGAPVTLGQLGDLGEVLLVDAADALVALIYEATDGNDQGMHLVDVSNPAAPALRGSASIPGVITDVMLHSDVAIVTLKSGDVQFFDTGQPAAPALLATYDACWDVLDADVTGDRLYLALGSDDALQVVDISDPADPRPFGLWCTRYPLPGTARAIAGAENYVHVASDTDGVTMVDMTDPLSPVTLSTLDTPGEAMDVAVMGSLVLVADRFGGLRVLWNAALAGP